MNENLNLEKIKSVYMIGIGGIGMSALARYFISRGIKVSGSDAKDSKIVQDLSKLGANIILEQNGSTLIDYVDLVVKTEAINDDNKDNIRAVENKKEIKLYAQMLGLISENYNTVAICGTHGKTTTTGLTIEAYAHANKSFIGIVGSLLKSGSNFVNNISSDASEDEKYFIVEACEYRRSFLNLKPKYLIITNIDADHLDYYKDIDDIKSAFLDLCKNVVQGGSIFYHGNDKNTLEVINAFKNNLEHDVTRKNKKIDLINADEMYADLNLDLNIYGMHNEENAKLVYSLCRNINISDEVTRAGLNKFTGTWRRCEYKGLTENGAIVIDDYAHHPAEVIATLQGVREKYLDKQIIGVFQPHLHSRTYKFLDQFVNALSLFDKVYILPIYRARSEEDYGMSNVLLADKINYFKNNNNFATPVTFDNVYDHFKDYGSDTVILTLGAGDNNNVAENLVKN